MHEVSLIHTAHTLNLMYFFKSTQYFQELNLSESLLIDLHFAAK